MDDASVQHTPLSGHKSFHVLPSISGALNIKISKFALHEAASPSQTALNAKFDASIVFLPFPGDQCGT